MEKNNVDIYKQRGRLNRIAVSKNKQLHPLNAKMALKDAGCDPEEISEFLQSSENDKE